jgi:hypothetical protein
MNFIQSNTLSSKGKNSDQRFEFPTSRTNSEGDHSDNSGPALNKVNPDNINLGWNQSPHQLPHCIPGG